MPEQLTPPHGRCPETRAGVPESISQLVVCYDALILWNIHRTLRRRAWDGEVEDIRQMVYERILEKDFLQRCRDYYATKPGLFSTSLSKLVQNLVLNYVDQQRRNPLLDAQLLPSARGPQPSPRMAAQARTDGFEARDFLDRVATRCAPAVQARVILRHAVEHGLHSPTLASLTGVSASRIRHRLVQIRSVASALREESRCFPDNTTKSAS